MVKLGHVRTGRRSKAPPVGCLDNMKLTRHGLQTTAQVEDCRLISRRNDARTRDVLRCSKKGVLGRRQTALLIDAHTGSLKLGSMRVIERGHMQC